MHKKRIARTPFDRVKFFGPLIGLVVLTFVPPNLPRSASAEIIITQGSVNLSVTPQQVVDPTVAKSTTLVYTRAGTDVNGAANEPDKGVITKKSKDPAAAPAQIQAIGKVDKEKFTVVGGDLVPNFISSFSVSVKIVSERGPNDEIITHTTTSTADVSANGGVLKSFDNKGNEISRSYTWGGSGRLKIDREDVKAPDGVAAGQASDPYAFSFSEDGQIAFSMSISDLLFSSDGILGSNHFDVSANLTGVSYRGTPLNGELFRLVIDSSGILGNKNGLAIDFVPWVGLGLSPSDITALDNYVRNNFDDLAGAVVLPGSLPLFGCDILLCSPIPSLTFAYAPGVVEIHSSVMMEASAVPEPRTATLLVLGLGLLMASGRRRSRAAVGGSCRNQFRRSAKLGSALDSLGRRQAS
jgi:hypothetical protein